MVHFSPLEEFDAPVYNRIHQEQIVAGMTVQHRDENPALQEHVIVQEIPLVSIVERIQEQFLVFAPHVVGSLPPFEKFDAPLYNQIDQELIVAGEITQHSVENPAVQEQVIVQEQVVGSLLPLEEFHVPVYNQTHQEQVVAGMATQHRVENPAVQEQVIVQEIPHVSIVERIQERIVSSAPQVICALSPLEEFDAPVYNQIHQEKIIAEEITQHRVGNPAVQEQVFVHGIPQVPQFVDSFPPLKEFVAPMCNQVLQEQIVATVQPHVRFQEIPEIQVVERIQEQIVEPIEAPLQEHVQLHTAFQIAHVPVPRIQEIPQEHLPERIAEQIVPGQIEEQIWDIPFLPIVEETVDLVPVLPHERLHPREHPHRPDEIVEAAALSVLENVFHERQRRVDHCVQVLEREKEKLRVLEERGVVPPHKLQSLRSHIQSGKDAMADAVRDLYECNQQVKRRRL